MASHAGFCFGVNRAVNAVFELLNDGKKVCTLGPIIHNPQFIDKLLESGVKIVERPEDASPDSVLVIRSHGVSQDVFQRINSLKLNYFDATCPFVKKIHNIVANTSRNNDAIFIAGDKNHPEVRGIIGHCNADVCVFNKSDELLDIIKNNENFSHLNVSVVAQTTFSVAQWNRCLDLLHAHYKNVSVFNTICSTTMLRQKEALELSNKADVMIVIGGKKSSNTSKLFNICNKNCRSFWIERFEDLQFDSIKNAKFIGITAGASTPADIIEEVKQKMEKMLKNNDVTKGEEMNFEQMLEESLKNFNTDDKVKGIVVGIAPNEVYVDVGRKHAGFIPAAELSNDPTAKPEDVVKIGDELELLIMRTNDQDGTIMLSKKRVDASKGFEKVIEANENNSVLTGKVVEVIKGGVIVLTNGIRIFIPASLATASKGENLEDLKGKEVNFRVIEVNEKRKRAIGSIRSVLHEEKKAAAESFFDGLEVGKILKGKVKSFTNYGAFIDLGPVDGMIHVSELAWERVKYPSEILNLGDEIEVSVKSFDKESNKISLSYKKAEDNPWEKLKNEYPVGSIVDAKIVGLTTYGAFANFLPGVDGLIHISQISDKKIGEPKDVLSIGDCVKVMITDIDFENHRISLSIKATLEKTNETESEEETNEDTSESAE